MIQEHEPLWTQEEAINFECAQETIGHMIAICSSLIDEEESKPSKNNRRIAELEGKRSVFARELRTLHLNDHAAIARVNTEYGSKIKSYLKEGGECPV